MKILILEAEAELKNQFNKFFSAQHYELINITDGNDAKEIIKDNNHNIDIILCDLDSPTKNGEELLIFIQQLPLAIPFVFITSSNQIHHITAKLKRGIWSYLVKPILNLGTLLVNIEQLCHQQQLLTANTAYQEQLSDKHKELEADHLAGYKIQQQLLPQNNKDILSLNFKYFLHPSLYVSGDFIDYQQLSDRYVVFYLSDVSGHGVSSAFVTVLLKACIQQNCSEFMHMNNPTAIDPKVMLTAANKAVCTENLGKYLTMVYMVYDQELSTLTYSVAGHFPFPIYIAEGESAKYIGERGYPIGMFKEASFVNYEIKLSKNFKIAVFSDGIMEVNQNQSLDDKEQSILDILTDHHEKELDIVQKYLSIDANDTLPDDIAGLFVTKS